MLASRPCSTGCPVSYGDGSAGLPPFSALCYRKQLDYTIALEDAKDNDFTGSSPAGFPRPIAAKHCLIAFNEAVERFPELLFICHDGTNGSEESLSSRPAGDFVKAQAVAGNAKDKIVEKPFFRFLGNPEAAPDGLCFQTAKAATATLTF